MKKIIKIDFDAIGEYNIPEGYRFDGILASNGSNLIILLDKLPEPYNPTGLGTFTPNYGGTVTTTSAWTTTNYDTHTDAVPVTRR